MMNYEIINRRKQELGLTNARIAEMTGITLSTLDKITAGANTNPKLSTLKAIAQVIGCTLDDFDDVPVVRTRDINQLTPELVALVQKYTSLDERGRATVDTVLEAELSYSRPSIELDTYAAIDALSMPIEDADTDQAAEEA
jgi:transcriptional regulator with XRE-family HTH domain